MTALSALADPTRQRIVEMLASGALSSGEIASRFDLSAPAVSQHLKTLKTARLVRAHADRQRRIYELNPDGVDELAQLALDPPERNPRHTGKLPQIIGFVDMAV